MEFFAGRGRITTCMKRSLFRSARVDLLDNQQAMSRRSNFMDLTHGSGYAFFGRNIRYEQIRILANWHDPRLGPWPRLAILLLLACKGQNFATHFGIKCSSFCKVNVGTSCRTASTPMGFVEYDSVKLANTLLERTGTCAGFLVKTIAPPTKARVATHCGCFVSAGHVH